MHVYSPPPAHSAAGGSGGGTKASLNALVKCQAQVYFLHGRPNSFYFTPASLFLTRYSSVPATAKVFRQVLVLKIFAEFEADADSLFALLFILFLLFIFP